jgi:hypothetical protein
MTEISREELTLTRKRRKAIGAFFTPSSQADFMVRHYKLHLRWAQGSSILDPTAGRGSLLESLIRVAVQENIPIDQEMLNRLHGVEKEKEFTRNFSLRISETYDIPYRINPIRVGDILTDENNRKVDILFGNPPWVNFTDLPEEEKENIKPHFLKYGLAPSAGKLLLGNSRIDLAALIIMKTMEANLKKGGDAYFFSPLSLILNEGAHNIFRKGIVKNKKFSIREIWDYNGFKIFRDVATRCGLLHLQRDREMEQIIPYHSMLNSSTWKKLEASPIAEKGSAYIITDPRRSSLPSIPRIPVCKESIPRQGINTGGRNNLYIFNTCKNKGKGLLELSNKDRTILLPEDLVYPLITTDQFRSQEEPSRYIFLPYTKDGTILTEGALKQYPSAWNYLEKNKEQLQNRKGVMMQSKMRRGNYWSLFGLGPYTFFPWKIVWESYGKRRFNPLLFSHFEGKPWIPNQALQAYCPFQNKTEAETLLKELKTPEVNKLLQSQNMQGTCNWAQPGRIKVFLQIT